MREGKAPWKRKRVGKGLMLWGHVMRRLEKNRVGLNNMIRGRKARGNLLL